jgi:hypothetical protein
MVKKDGIKQAVRACDFCVSAQITAEDIVTLEEQVSLYSHSLQILEYFL